MRGDFVEEQHRAAALRLGNQIGVRKLSLRGKVGRLMQPRAKRNRRLLEAFTALAGRLAELGVREEVVTAALDKVEHEGARSMLPRPRLLRVAPVLREVRTGRYSSRGRGAPDILRDLVQPAD